MSAARSFLFLQGGSSPFFRRLGRRLSRDGHAVHRVNFSAGDRAYWHPLPAASFDGTLDDLPAYLEDRMRAWSISDVVIYGDRRPVHVPAIAIARRLGIRVQVFEEGYFRPFLMTLERGGVNGNSALPRDPDWYRKVGACLPDSQYGAPFHSGLFSRARHDITYEIASLANPLLFPRYRTHVPYNRWIGYGAHALRFAAMPLRASRDRQLLERLNREKGGVFLLPLQLESDVQIRYYSPYPTMSALIEHVMRSFARGAPPDARLVIKNHPLDPGFVNYERLTARLARETGITGRVDYVDTGDASPLAAHARGIVTVNSTVGMSSLMLGRPVIALGKAIYNLPGLTFQGPLDDFWRDPPPPDAELFRRFRNTVIHTTQINGGFYTRESTTLAVENCQRILLAERSPLEALMS